MWRSLIDTNPDIDYLPQAYLEYPQALDFSGDLFGAALALEELMVHYPARIEARRAVDLREELLLVDKTLAARLAPQRTILAEKWKHTPPLIASPPGEDAAPASSQYPMTTGGAE